MQRHSVPGEPVYLCRFLWILPEKSFPRSAILALASIPIAIAPTPFASFGTGLCVQYWDPDKALGFFHEFSGWVMFLVSLGCLFVVHRIMSLVPALRRMA